MTANAGFEVGFHGEYRRSSRPSGWSGPRSSRACLLLEALSTVTFTEAGGHTTVRVSVQHASQENRDAHINSGMEDGLQEALDQMEEVARSLR